VTDARVVAEGFLADLDRNDATAVEAWFTPDATWWVDTGRDRAAGVEGHDPGDDRSWPLHATMPGRPKARLLQGLPERFPDGVRQRAWNTIGHGPWVVVEVEGDGLHVSGVPYRNRYAFVIEVADGHVATVREYLDTLHAASVFASRGIDRRSEADVAIPAPVEPATSQGRVALAFVAGITAGDLDAFRSLLTDDATWWADSGTDRDAGRHDIVQAEPRHPFHGRIRIDDKLAAMRGIDRAFPDGLTLYPRRLIEDGDTVAVEVVGDAVHRSGRRYQNRYVFVLEVAGDRLAAVREYCDTLHVADTFGIDVPV
jgi:ketosteroid isomerase-like protein